MYKFMFSILAIVSITSISSASDQAKASECVVTNYTATTSTNETAYITLTQKGTLEEVSIRYGDKTESCDKLSIEPGKKGDACGVELQENSINLSDLSSFQSDCGQLK